MQTLIYEFVAQCKLGVLGTVSAENEPQSALVGIAVTPRLEIVFDTLRSTRKYRNLRACPACSFAIGWAAEQTVQYQGIAEELTESNAEEYRRIYFSVWPDGPSRLTWPGIVYFVVRPSWIRYSDFAQAPALVHEVDFTQ